MECIEVGYIWLHIKSNKLFIVSNFFKVAIKNLVILEISPHDIIAVSICNMRGTTVLWDKETGSALHNAIGWYSLV